jgi:lysophospholipase L1-like esterase
MHQLQDAKCGALDYTTDYLDSLHHVLRNLHALAQDILADPALTGRPRPLRVAVYGAGTPGWLAKCVLEEHQGLDVACFVDAAPHRYRDVNYNLNIFRGHALPVHTVQELEPDSVDAFVCAVSPGAHPAVLQAIRQRFARTPVYCINHDPRATSLRPRGTPFILATAQRCGTLWTAEMLKFASEASGYRKIHHKRPDGSLDYTLPGRLGTGQYAVGHYRLTPPLRALLAGGGLNAVFLYRDPRDIQVSLCFYNQRTAPDPRFAFDPETLRAVAAHIREWQRFGRAMLLSFEELKAAPAQTFARLCGHVGWDLPPQRAEAIVEACSFQKLSGRTEGTEDRNAHYRKGVSGDWRNHYDADARAQAKAICGDLLVELGYEAFLHPHRDLAGLARDMEAAMRRVAALAPADAPLRLWLYGGDRSGCAAYSFLRGLPGVDVRGVFDRCRPKAALAGLRHVRPRDCGGADGADVLLVTTAPRHYAGIQRGFVRVHGFGCVAWLFAPARENLEAPAPFPAWEPLLTEHYGRSRPRRCALVMLGDSLTQCYPDWNELLGRQDVCNRGVGGDNTRLLAARLEHVLRLEPACVLLMAGIADLLNGADAADAAAGCTALLQRLLAAGVRPVVQSTLPVCYPDQGECARKYTCATVNARVREHNALLQEHCRGLGVDYVDLWPALAREGRLRPECTSDGIHLNIAGYLAWRDALADAYGPGLRGLAPPDDALHGGAA